MTLAELNALADRQRRQIEEQEKTLTAKQQRLSFLTQQSQQGGMNDRRDYVAKDERLFAQ